MTNVPIITCFCLPNKSGGVDAIAVDEDGKFITAQACTSPAWMRQDLDDTLSIKPFHVWFYNKRYPDGYDLEFLSYGNTHPKWDGQREHTDESARPWHLDKFNESTY